MDLKDREQKADVKAMANMYCLALDAQKRIPGRCCPETRKATCHVTPTIHIYSPLFISIDVVITMLTTS